MLPGHNLFLHLLGVPHMKDFSLLHLHTERESIELSATALSPGQPCVGNQNRIFNVSILKYNSLAYKIRVEISFSMLYGDPNSMGSVLGMHTVWKSLVLSWYFGIKAVITSFLNPF